MLVDPGPLLLFIYTGGIKNLQESLPFSIESFYKFVSERKLMANQCNKCGTLFLPPRPLCTECFTTEFEWVRIKGKGKLVSYTVIHVAPEKFQDITPYPIGIIALDEGPTLPGIIRGVDHEKIKIGMDLTVGFDLSTSPQWPYWPKYYFKAP